MNKFLLFFLSIHFFACSQKKQSLNLNEIKIVSVLEYNSKDDKTAKKTLHTSFKRVLGKSDLYSKNGDYWKGVDFKLYPICLVKNNTIKTIFVLKEIQLPDGSLSELYIIKLNQNNDLVDCKKIAKQESTGNCESDFVLKISETMAEIIQNETCEIGSQSDDENEDTTESHSEKTVIDLNN